MKKFSAPIAMLICMALILGFAFAPSSCTLTPQQQARLQAISVPVTALGLNYAKSRGLVSDGDVITLQRGVAVVVSADATETKLFKLAEIGLTDAVQRGLFVEGQTAELHGPDVHLSHPPDVELHTNPVGLSEPAPSLNP